MLRRSALFASLHRAAWVLLFAAALIARLASPSGWMPDADAAGVHLVPCDGMAPATPRAMPGMAHHHHDHRAPVVDHPCAFAGLGLALAEPLPPPHAIPPSPEGAVRRSARAAVAIGRGLAAPPPPSTGPPALA